VRADLVIQNGRILDGTGAPELRGDLAIRGGKIASLGKEVEAEDVIDATGCHVVEVEGTRAGSRRVLRYTALGPSLREVQAWIPGSTNMSFKVGMSAAIMVEMLARGQVAPSGVYPPECLEAEPRELFLERLRANHFPLEVRETT